MNKKIKVIVLINLVLIISIIGLIAYYLFFHRDLDPSANLNCAEGEQPVNIYQQVDGKEKIIDAKCIPFEVFDETEDVEE